MSHNTLENYYTSRHSVCVRRKLWTITEWENMYPWERDLHVGMVKNDDEIAAEQARQQQAIMDAKARKGY